MVKTVTMKMKKHPNETPLFSLTTHSKYHTLMTHTQTHTHTLTYTHRENHHSTHHFFFIIQLTAVYTYSAILSAEPDALAMDELSLLRLRAFSRWCDMPEMSLLMPLMVASVEH